MFPRCGRYRPSRRKQIIEEPFGTEDWQDDWCARFNIAPAQPVPVIRQHPKEPIRQVSNMRWGLIPFWARGASGAASTVNARSETAATKPAFRDALKSRRCLIPADAFYELVRTTKAKQPFCFEVNEGDLFAFAGLWDRWKDPHGTWIKACSILTTTPNAVTSVVHDRMPVILELLKPYDARLMHSYPVSSRVNHVANDDEECSRAVEPARIQNGLFQS